MYNIYLNSQWKDFQVYVTNYIRIKQQIKNKNSPRAQTMCLTSFGPFLLLLPCISLPIMHFVETNLYHDPPFNQSHLVTDWAHRYDVFSFSLSFFHLIIVFLCFFRCYYNTMCTRTAHPHPLMRTRWEWAQVLIFHVVFSFIPNYLMFLFLK